MQKHDQGTSEFLCEILSMDEFENEVLTHELMQNFRIIDTLFKSIPPQLNDIYSHLKSAKKSSFTSLRIINNKIRSKELVTEKSLIMFITSEPKKDQRVTQFSNYKALIITSLFLKNINKTGIKDISSLTQEMRLLLTGKSSKVVSQLPDLNDHKGDRFRNEWLALIDRYQDNITLQQRLKSLFKLTQDFLSFLPPDEVTHLSHKQPKWYKQGFVKETITADYDEQISLANFTTNLDIEDIDPQEWDTLDEDSLLSESSKQSLINQTSITADFDLERRQAKSIAANIVRQKLRLNCSTSQATKHDIKSLLNYCLSSASETYQYLLLMLFSGKDITSRSDIKWTRKNGNITGYLVEYELPTTKNEDADLAPTVATKIEIPIPTIIFQSPTMIPLNDTQTDKFQAAIKLINKSANSHLTISKVAGFFSQYLKQQNVDIIFDAIFSGHDVRNTPALFYTKVATTQLLTIKQKYLTALNLLIKNQSFENKNNNLSLPDFDFSRPQEMGSPLPVTEENLIAMFTALKSKVLNLIAEIPGCHRCENLISGFYLFHIYYTVFVQTIITFSSGYRPVNGWGGTLTDYFIEESMLWISDKEYIKGDSSRLVVLPQTTMDILKQYIDYLKVAYKNIGDNSPKAKLRIQQTLNGEDHLFFYLLEDGLPVDAKPKDTLQYLTVLSGVDLNQANWGRHQMRTYLHNARIPTEHISAWMGHSQGQLHSHGHFSSLSFEGVQEIAKHIDSLLKRLGIEEFSW
ncbi:hypothetical protein [Vibrio cincinnatiensis]|uniref:hypothetical protein n=1 Tax=Vibrio cincinnatiensis TaxID=675 RepID=UPI001EDCA943|nr:hypothetical protein [Vibrio cincinnatiensis]MCG3737864.1 hypothetical protein [Vibrio cincinnatiensis]